MKSYQIKTITILMLCMISVTFAAPSTLHADIYLHIDEDGVYNFTDAPPSSKYKLFIKERKPRPVKKKPLEKFDKYIEEASKRHKVSFPLLKAVAKVESDFNPKAVSKKGAKGLMQIMPMNFELLKIKDPFNPRESIMGGARYLSQLLNRFRGDVRLAVAAYNAGPDSVERFQNIPPIKETKDYVKKIMKYYALYKKE